MQIGLLSMQTPEDLQWMTKTLKLAKRAASLGEVPIGAIVVSEGQMISSAFNWRETGKSPLAHAELIALHRAARKLGRWRLWGCTLYVNLEPCVMCAGALVNSRIDRVVYGAADPKGGAVETLYKILEDKRLNHRPIVTSGVLESESAEILSGFFAVLRRNKN
ncbi:MAG: tRNA adenosine(34) deaminase TadA [Bdellovibrionia bacterium]